MAADKTAARTPAAAANTDASPVLEIRNLNVEFELSGGRRVQAVDGFSCVVSPGKTLGIVGESGSGKTTVVRAILRIVDAPGKITRGEMRFHGKDLLKLSESEMRALRGRKIAMVFQDPSGSLDPLYTIGQQFIETIRTHQKCSRKEAYDRALAVLELVGVPNPAEAMDAYPMSFNSGMVQRIMIGMAISCEPDLILADEPTTTLGVLLQAQILNELIRTQRRLNTAMIMITHDMGVVAHAADDVLVMYAGRCVEYGAKEPVLLGPLHPYTVGLMGSVPELDGERTERLAAIPGFPPDLANLPQGCPFADRCYRKLPVCESVRPELVELEPGHFVACHSPVPAEERRPLGDA